MKIGAIHSLAMSVQASAQINNNDLNTSLERLSSGLRINKAADDASSMLIAHQLTSDAYGVMQEIKNRNDEIGLLQIADRAMDEQSSILETVKVKLVQRASDTQSSSSILAINKDIGKLLDSYDDIVKTTSYNGKKLLSGTYQSSKGLNIQNTAVSSIGHVSIKEFETITLGGTTQFTLTDGDKSMTFESMEIGYTKGTGVGELSRVINAQSSETGVQASYVVKSISAQAIQAGLIEDLKINDITIGSITVEDNDNDKSLTSAINLHTTQTGVTASVDSEGKLVLASQDGRGIKLDNAQDLKILAENYGKLSLTKSGASDIEIDATGIYEGMNFTQKNATLDYVNNQDVVERAGSIDAGGYSELTADMITNYTTGSGVYNTSDLMNIAAAKTTYNLDGTGYAVAIIDTGIDAAHDFFDDRVVVNLDFTGEGLTGDVNGHGTHVASTVGSSDATYTGAASGVDLIGLKALEDDGSGTSAMIEDALQWVIANADTYNIAVINMSLGDPTNNNTAQDALSVYGDELETLANMGIINVAAAGNSYSTYDPLQGASYPANSAYTIGVGAVFGDNTLSGASWGGPDGNILTLGDNETAYTAEADRITPFSQRSTEVVDIFAVGAPVYAADSANLSDAKMLTGTSQASPQVAGIAVLVQEYAEKEFGRTLTLEEMRDLLVNTAVTINDGDDEDDNVANTGADYKRIDALGAIKALAALKELLAPAVERGNTMYDHAGNNKSVDEITPLLMTIADFAIRELTAVRSDIGSTQNMLQSDVNYKSIQSVRLLSSASQLQDVDFAEESQNLSKKIILAQASTFAMAKITQQYDMIAQLLR
ncbi:MAG: flagellin [Sulfurimonas sp.]|jgi:flagellin|uniref:S8 family serine peptidase n=1 Tax=Sulfurimonas sp. TaxID=2022749 RepID=UPI0039E5EF72